MNHIKKWTKRGIIIGALTCAILWIFGDTSGAMPIKMTATSVPTTKQTPTANSPWDDSYSVVSLLHPTGEFASAFGRGADIDRQLVTKLNITALNAMTNGKLTRSMIIDLACVPNGQRELNMALRTLRHYPNVQRVVNLGVTGVFGAPVRTIGISFKRQRAQTTMDFASKALRVIDEKQVCFIAGGKG